MAEEYSPGLTESGGNSHAMGDRPHQLTVHKSENYGDASFMDEQSRLTDLIPRRILTFAMLLVAGTTAITGIEALHVWTPDLLPKAVGRIALVDLTTPGNLANWFSSLMLLAAGFASLQVYSIRRHQINDYHGRYRVWLWASACWFLLATDVAAGLHLAIQQIMTGVTGTRVIGDGSIWWAVPATFLFGAIGSRLVIDMRASRLSTATLILSIACYTAAIVLRTTGLLSSGSVNQVLALQGALMAGHLLLLLAMGLHARYVILDAEGLLPRRAEPKEKKEKVQPKLTIAKTEDDEAEVASSSAEEEDAAEQNDDSSDQWVAVDAPHAKSQPVLKRVGPGPSPAPVAALAADPSKPATAPKAAPPSPHAEADADADNQKLSKADRKALKKRLIDERLQREQKKASGWGK
jgi:hypothetical protein